MEQGYTWTLDDGNKYTVVSIVKEKGKKYVYLINRSEIQKYIIAEYDGDDIIEVEDPDLLEALIVKFNEDLKENLSKIISENM
jgi:hypothetical protein